MKKTLFLKTLMLSAATVALFGMTACSGSDDNIIGDEPITEQPAAVKTYQVSIPATMPGDEQTRAVSFDGTTSTSTFKTTDKIYAYNETKTAWSREYLDWVTLTPSANAQQTELNGTLAFARWNGSTFDAVTPEVGDVIHLFYNISNPDFSPVTSSFFDYGSQTGSASSASAHDYAKTTMKIKSIEGSNITLCQVDDDTKLTASFQPVQSMFRFKFVDENNNPITVKTLRIQSTGWDIAAYYWPLDNDPFGTNNIMVTPSSPTSDYLYVAICINEDETPSALEFTVKDNDGNEYKGTKSAPSGGFKNGKYYYNTSAITLTKQDARIEPTITWNNGSAVSPNEYNFYDVYATEITLSGTSKGYYFYMNHGATIHLSNLTATYDNDNFIYGAHALTLDISGANSITTKNFWAAIYSVSTLKLSGSGTLTVTVNGADRYGIKGANYNYIDGTNSDASVLAKTGFTVSRSDMTNNGDGTYTWTYTVAPNN